MNLFLTWVVFLIGLAVLFVMALAMWEIFRGKKTQQDAEKAFKKALIEKTLREIENRKSSLRRR